MVLPSVKQDVIMLISQAQLSLESDLLKEDAHQYLRDIRLHLLEHHAVVLRFIASSTCFANNLLLLLGILCERATDCS